MAACTLYMYIARSTMMVCELAFAEHETRDLFSFWSGEDNEKMEWWRQGKREGGGWNNNVITIHNILSLTKCEMYRNVSCECE